MWKPPPFEQIMAKLEPRLLALGFRLNPDRVEKDWREYRRGDFEIVFSVERYENHITVWLYYLMDKDNMKSHGGVYYDLYRFMKILDHFMFKRYDEAITQGDAESQLVTLLVFLERHGDLVCQYPLPQPLRSRYMEALRADAEEWPEALKKFDSPDKNPLGMECLPLHLKKIS